MPGAGLTGPRWTACGGANFLDETRRSAPGDPRRTHSAVRLDLPPEQVMMVAAHNDDLGAARACGLKTGFFARPTEYGPEQVTDREASEA